MNDTIIAYDARKNFKRLKNALKLDYREETREAYAEIRYYRDEYLVDLMLNECEKSKLEKFLTEK